MKGKKAAKSIIYNAIPTGVDDNELLQRDKYYF